MQTSPPQHVYFFGVRFNRVIMDKIFREIKASNFILKLDDEISLSVKN